MLHLLLDLLFRYIWDLKKMRIFKNEITFWYFVLNGIQMGYSRPTDFFETCSVWVAWNLKGSRRFRR